MRFPELISLSSAVDPVQPAVPGATVRAMTARLSNGRVLCWHEVSGAGAIVCCDGSAQALAVARRCRTKARP